MGQCGCGETNVERAFKLPTGVVVAYDIYHGCDECFAGPGVTVFVYTDDTSEWLESAKIEKYEPDEYGGNRGTGIPISFFEVRDLIEAAKNIGGVELNEDDGYESVDGWLEDYGLQMMQDAMRIFEKRIKKLVSTEG